jgi:hypothetical protein
VHPKTTKPSSLNDSARCQHQTRNGRCRMPAAPSATLCSEHSRLVQKELDQADLSATLMADIEDFRSALPINEFLSRLLRYQTSGRIAPRRAAVMAYTCNLLLRTLPAIEHEAGEEEQKIIIDMPGPRRDDPTYEDLRS